MAIRSTCAAIRPTTTSPSTACATAPSTAAPIRSTSSRSKSTTAPTRCSTARARSAARSISSRRSPQRDDLTILQARDRHRRLLPRRRSTPTSGVSDLDRGAAQRHVPPQRRARPRRRGISSAGASRRRSRSASTAPTSLTLAYVHQQDDNTPIYGVPYFQQPDERRPARRRSTTATISAIATSTSRRPRSTA